MKTKFSGILTLLIVLIVQLSFAQEKTISGTVADDTGLPLPGVNIIIKGTSTGTQSDFDGNYSIEAAVGQTLVYSYVGFETQEIAVGASNTIDVAMQGGEALTEVVVTALGISREKKSLGYSTQQVSSEELNETRPTSALGALSGKVAGVSISSPSGGLGGSTRVLLRGASSITQENKPLIVVDGIPLDNSNYNSTATQNGGGGRDYGDAGFDVNPDDIESVNVLKGGAAAALYGSRASNGVILITTKTGKKGKATVTVNSGVTFDQVSILPKVQKLYGGGAGDASTFEQSTFSTAVINGTTYNIADYSTDESWGPLYDGQQVLQWDNLDPAFPADYLNPREWKYPDVDKKDFFNTGMTRNNGVSFTQGSDKAQMRLSINNSQTEGIVPNTELERTTFNFNGSAQISEKLKFDAGVNFTSTDGFNRPATGYTGTGVIQQLYQFGQTQLDYDRLKKYKNPDGTQRSWNRTAYNDPTILYTDNPYWTLYENTAEDKRTRWFGNVGTQYNLTDGLYVVGKVYADTYSLRIQERVAVGSQATSSYSNADRTFSELNYEARLHYDKNFFNDKLSFNGFVGGTRRDVETHRTSLVTNGGLATPGIYSLNNSNAPITGPPGIQPQNDSRKRVNSLFASVSFGYDGLVFISATGRNDWSSTLPADNNSYFYPSLNGSFVFSQLIDAKWLSFGKIRGGVARVGNDTDAYNLNNTFISDGPFQQVVQFQNSSIKLNPNLKPEFVDTFEAGLEMSFLNKRIGFDFTYYDQKTTDLITPIQLDPSTGYRSTFTNAGVLTNKGVEVLVNISPIRSDDFNWDFTFNFAKNKNELQELLPGVESLNLATYPFNGVTLNAVVGESYGQIVGTNYVFDNDGNKVVDANGYYMETQKVENLGSVLPDYNMGFRNSFSYKGLNLSFLIDVQEGGVYRSLTNLWGHYSGILESTAANNIRVDGVVNEGVTGDVTYNDDGSYTVTNTAPNETAISAQAWGTDFYFGNDAQNVFDASYVKLREVTLGYTLPKKFTGSLDAITLSVFGRNLATWGLSNDNFDPEVATAGSGNIQGSEGGALPSTRSVGFNVQLKF
ncbi:SusC/RagA family TonB-linked outer membrane protein [Aequorivita capsosiphonis]|uniref:SusC/RagA family TonB-linked outer membrane protein n=1 Tax=Aequorivita capsosiphonis TaxID=487317 RepID=UPI000478D70E|nr:SusC/RagA family TonB-linked outer membrane protein [Aequorivita capsosiphonis]